MQYLFTRAQRMEYCVNFERKRNSDISAYFTERASQAVAASTITMCVISPDEGLLMPSSRSSSSQHDRAASRLDRPTATVHKQAAEAAANDRERRKR